jgi:hypothetical protein
MGDTWWVIIICPCVNVFNLMGGVTEADVGFSTVIIIKKKTKIIFFLYRVQNIHPRSSIV